MGLHWYTPFGQVVIGVIGTAVWVVVVPVVGFAVIRVSARRRQNRAKQFFGAQRDVAVRVSNISVKPHGTQGLLTPVAVGFHGTAITEGEYRAALAVADAIEVRTGPAMQLYQVAAEKLGMGQAVRALRCRIGVSPTYSGMAPPSKLGGSLDDIPGLREVCAGELSRADATVVIGSEAYNALAKYFFEEVGDAARIVIEHGADPDEGLLRADPQAWGRHITLHGTMREDGVARRLERRKSQGPDNVAIYYEYFWIIRSRSVRGTSGNTVILCAGTSTAATYAAALKLADWESLRKTYGSDDFVLACELETSQLELGSADFDVLPRVWYTSVVGSWSAARTDPSMSA